MPESVMQANPRANVSGKPLYALIAEFADPAALYHAAEKIRDAGFTRWDVYSPFPIHGMDAAMGVKKSPLGYLVFCGGLTGSLTGLGLQWWTSAVNYPLIVHGKPFLSLPAFFPIIFELTILFSAFTTVFGLMLLCRLPQFHHQVFAWDGFKRATDDAFFLAIEATDPKFSADETPRILREAGAMEVSEIHKEDEEGRS